MKKEKRAKFTKANILIPFQLLLFLSSSSSSWLPFLCQVAKQISRFLWFPLREQDFDQGQKLFTKLNSKNSLVHSSNSSSNFFLPYTRVTTFPFSFFLLLDAKPIEFKKFAQKRASLRSPVSPNYERRAKTGTTGKVFDRRQREGRGKWRSSKI